MFRTGADTLLRLVAGVVLLLSVGPAHGDDVVAKARSLYSSGTSHYNLNEFDDALRDFKEAYRLKNDPAFLFNIAQCYRQLGDPRAAASFYRSFRRERPDAPNREEIDRLIEEMDRAAAKAPAQPPAAEPTAAPPETTAPSRAASEPPSTTAVSSEVVAAPAPRTDRKPVSKRAWVWAVVGGGVLVVGGAIALGVVFGRPSNPSASLGKVFGD